MLPTACHAPRLATQLTSGAAAFTSRFMTNAPRFAPLLATLTPGRKNRSRVTHVDAAQTRNAGLNYCRFSGRRTGHAADFFAGDFFVGFFLGGQAIIRPWRAKFLSITGGMTMRQGPRG
jgi:hypothetical protein